MTSSNILNRAFYEYKNMNKPLVLEQIEIMRRILEGGGRDASLSKRDGGYVDYFQHSLDELERLKTYVNKKN